MKFCKSIFFIILIIAVGCNSNNSDKESKQKPVTESKQDYEPTWESLNKHTAAPEWFSDAKFGIYFHWGVYTVPAYGFEWYPRLMHKENDKYFGSYIYKHHRETYGTPSEFGYHDFVPQFKAEKFDANQWAELFKKSGAKFAGPVAMHSDGFAMWASKATPWNALDKGPHKDIVGELEKAIKAEGLKFITTFHQAINLQRYKDKPDETYFKNSYYPYIKGMPPTSEDPELKYLYGNIPEQQWLSEVWFPELKEVIDNYSPDIIWFDSGLDLIPEDYRKKMCAYYLNHAQTLDKEVVIVRKQEDLPLDLSINDLEKSRRSTMGTQPWMTDETISSGSWCYTGSLKIKPFDKLLYVLIDIVSKDGVLLLNISPKEDGTIPENQTEVLLKMGDWLNKYGEAIYATRPWYTFGEGPTRQPKGDFENHSDFKKVKYCADDIRYTSKDNIIYAMTLGFPGVDKDILLKSFAKDSIPGSTVEDVALLGCEDRISYEQSPDGLHVKTPKKMDKEESLVFKILLSK